MRNHNHYNLSGGSDTVCKKDKRTVEEGYSFPDSVFFGSDVTVHDPAIFKDPKDGMYYVFGSHFAVACSEDLIHWRQIAKDGQYQSLYKADWKKVLSSGFAHSNRNYRGAVCGSTWAPDVLFHGEKYYMYASLSTFGSSVSAIVRVEADSVLGPYRNERVIVTSSLSGDANCIDPQIFEDQAGRLFLIYGSFFGGIFIKELENQGAKWGLPKESGYGKLLWKGQAPPDAAQGGPEGAFMFFRGGYYYLMVSDGSLFSNYHLRVARSTDPLGPFYDISGADMASAHGKGNKLAGNFKFEGERGLAAYGHNSVCEKGGEFFVVGHIRHEEQGKVSGVHNVQVQRMLFNEEGWPVLAPMRYAGEKLGKIQADELVGDYDLILHDGGRGKEFVCSSRYTLTGEQTVTHGGAVCGVWSYQAEGNYIEMTLDGVRYKGVAMPAWTAHGGRAALSATSDQGRPLWAIGRFKMK